MAAKTNAIRQVEAKKLEFKTYEYGRPGEFLDGVAVAAAIGEPVEKVYKTLVTQGASRQYFVCMIPVDKELDLKKGAKALNEKKLEMIASKEITTVTGYIKGGCSPLGMKKQFRTIIDERAKLLKTIIFSGGKIGLQMEMETEALRELAGAEYGEIV